MHYFLDRFLFYFRWSTDEDLRDFVITTCFDESPPKAPKEKARKVQPTMTIQDHLASHPATTAHSTPVLTTPASTPGRTSDRCPSISALSVSSHLSKGGSARYDRDKLSGAYYLPYMSKKFDFVRAADWSS